MSAWERPSNWSLQKSTLTCPKVRLKRSLAQRQRVRWPLTVTRWSLRDSSYLSTHSSALCLKRLTRSWIPPTTRISCARSWASKPTFCLSSTSLSCKLWKTCLSSRPVTSAKRTFSSSPNLQNSKHLLVLLVVVIDHRKNTTTLHSSKNRCNLSTTSTEQASDFCLVQFRVCCACICSVSVLIRAYLCQVLHLLLVKEAVEHKPWRLSRKWTVPRWNTSSRQCTKRSLIAAISMPVHPSKRTRETKIAQILRKITRDYEYLSF